MISTSCQHKVSRCFLTKDGQIRVACSSIWDLSSLILFWIPKKTSDHTIWHSMEVLIRRKVCDLGSRSKICAKLSAKQSSMSYPIVSSSTLTLWRQTSTISKILIQKMHVKIKRKPFLRKLIGRWYSMRRYRFQKICQAKIWRNFTFRNVWG